MPIGVVKAHSKKSQARLISELRNLGAGENDLVKSQVGQVKGGWRSIL